MQSEDLPYPASRFGPGSPHSAQSDATSSSITTVQSGIASPLRHATIRAKSNFRSRCNQRASDISSDVISHCQPSAIRDSCLAGLGFSHPRRLG